MSCLKGGHLSPGGDARLGPTADGRGGGEFGGARRSGFS